MGKTSLNQYARDEYLNIPAVIHFRDWLEDRLDAPEGFKHQYYLVKAGRNWQCRSLYEAYQNYWWPYKMLCPVQKKEVFGTGSEDTFVYLHFLAGAFRSSLDTNDVDLAYKSALAMLRWGGVLHRNRECLDSMGSGLCDYFRKAKEHLTLSKVRLGSHDEIWMNSGFTKLYFLLVDNFIMYDGRVGAALGLLGRIYAEEAGLEKIPPSFEFSYGSGKELNKQKKRNRRDPGRGKYRLPLFNGRQNRHCNDNIKASWLLKSLADRTSSRFARIPQGPLLNERLTAIQSALFMIGYDVK